MIGGLLNFTPSCGKIRLQARAALTLPTTQLEYRVGSFIRDLAGKADDGVDKFRISHMPRWLPDNFVIHCFYPLASICCCCCCSTSLSPGCSNYPNLPSWQLSVFPDSWGNVCSNRWRSSPATA